MGQAPVHIQYAGYNDPLRRAIQAQARRLSAAQGHILLLVYVPGLSNKIVSKAGAEPGGPVTGWRRFRGATTRSGEKPSNTVPQVKRGLLWDWPGQPCHLPPPSVSF